MTVHRSFETYKVENAAKVAMALTGYMSGNLDGILELCDEEIVWRSVALPEHASFGGTFHGRDGVRVFFERMLQSVQMDEIKVLDVLAAGDEVIQVVEFAVRAQPGGRLFRIRAVGLWRFRGPRAVAYTDYFDVAAAVIESAGDGVNAVVSPELLESLKAYRSENAVLVAQLLSRYSAGEVDALLRGLDDDIEWQSMADSRHLPFGGRYHGIEGVRTFLSILQRTYAIQAYDTLDIIPAGDEVVHIADLTYNRLGKPHESLSVRLVCFWTFRAQRATAYREYFDVSAVLALEGGLQ